MSRSLFLSTLFFFSLCTLNAQIIFSEDFESGSLPVGWTIESNASDGGWLVGTPAGLSSSFFDILPNGSTRIVATNDDGCNCDKSNEYLITPAIDLSDQTAAVLKFDAFYTDQSYQGDQEDATIEVSTNGSDWEVLEDLHGHGSWDTHTINLEDYLGEATVYIGFRYDDDNGWLYGFGLDNVIVEVPPSLEAALVEVEKRPYGEIGVAVPIKGTVFNGGATEINSLTISYQIDGGTPVVTTIDNLSIPAFEYETVETTTPWIPDTEGNFSVEVSITDVNGQADADPSNNSGNFDSEIFPLVVPPNLIDEFLLADPISTVVADASDQLDKPSDLDFFPIMGKDELWVINQRTENQGGSTLTISDASEDTPSDFWLRVDGNAWHFMSIPTALAFSPDNYNFASSPGVQDANHNGGTFTGPTLWSSDPAIYAQPSGGNGSHLDMLHGSPFSMGIAHEVDNVFWVFDDWNNDIVRYDFVDDHGPGNDDHSDAIVRRYKDIGILAAGDIPNHMILDKNTGWLYIVDNGNSRVLRLDINSGSVANSLPLINEPLAEHSQMGGFTYETIINSGIPQPCGIEIMENRLLVGDYATGDIFVFDMDNNFTELGRITTGDGGLTGIKVGPDGSIWYTNRSLNQLVKLQPGEPSATTEVKNNLKVALAPNPTTGAVTIYLQGLNAGQEIQMELSDLSGKNIRNFVQTSDKATLHLSDLQAGSYILRGTDGKNSFSEKLFITK